MGSRAEYRGIEGRGGSRAEWRGAERNRLERNVLDRSVAGLSGGETRGGV